MSITGRVAVSGRVAASGRVATSGRVTTARVTPPIAGLAFCYDVRSLGPLAASTAISSLADISGNGRTLAQATGGNQPTIAAGNQSNRLVFAGSQFMATAANEALLGPAPLSFYAICAPSATASQRSILSVGNSGVTQGASCGVRNSAWSAVDEAVGTFDGTLFTAGVVTLLLLERTTTGSNPVYTWNLYADGVNVVTFDRTYITVIAGKVYLGQRGNAAARWLGDFYAAGGIGRLFTAGEKTTLLTYKGTFV